MSEHHHPHHHDDQKHHHSHTKDTQEDDKHYGDNVTKKLKSNEGKEVVVKSDSESEKTHQIEEVKSTKATSPHDCHKKHLEGQVEILPCPKDSGRSIVKIRAMGTDIELVSGPDGSVAKVLYGLAPIVTQNQLEAESAKAMVLSCMDFRLLDDIVYFMNALGYNNNYDQFILAGSSLGFNQEKWESWGALWKQHLELAKKLHHVKEIICIDHDKCGAYKLFYPEMKPEEERQHHEKNLQKFKDRMKELYPDLGFRGFFIKLDGTADEIKFA
jgi:hypothetical protein